MEKIIEFLKEFDYKYIVAGIVIAILYMVWYSYIRPKRIRKDVREVLEKIAYYHGYSIEEVKDRTYDFKLTSLGNAKYEKILIRIIDVPKISAITINNKDTWNLQYGGSGEPGKSYLYHRYIDELKGFLNKEVDENTLKLIIVYKTTKKIQRYLNESEIEITKHQDKIYDYKVITFYDLYSHFTDL